MRIMALNWNLSLTIGEQTSKMSWLNYHFSGSCLKSNTGRVSLLLRITLIFFFYARKDSVRKDKYKRLKIRSIAGVGFR